MLPTFLVILLMGSCFVLICGLIWALYLSRFQYAELESNCLMAKLNHHQDIALLRESHDREIKELEANSALYMDYVRAGEKREARLELKVAALRKKLVQCSKP